MIIRSIVYPILQLINKSKDQFNYYLYQEIQKMRKVVILFFMIIVTFTQPSTLTKAQEVSQQQQRIRASNNMSYTNVKTYTFVCGRFDDFVLKPSISEIVKVQIHVYWKQQNVYVSAQYRQGQEIRVIVYEDNQRVLLDKQFYMTTGFSFNVTKGLSYTVRFLAAGRVTKLVSMINSFPIEIHQDVATKEHIDGAQQKVETISNQLRALMTISQRNFLMKEQLGSKVLSNTKIYMGYQILEVILIIGVAIFQVTSLTKLLKGSSIV